MLASKERRKVKIMFINETKREIIVSKTEYTKAMKIGTPEFEDLFRSKQICPNAKVIIKKSNNKNIDIVLCYRQITVS